MLTVLIRYRETRREVLIPAKCVEYIPPGKTPVEKEIATIDQPGLLINHGGKADNGFHLGLTPIGEENFKDVFIMNDHGQTVARYIL